MSVTEIVKIQEIKFRSRNIDWNLVEDELHKYEDKVFVIKASQEEINIGKDFADEFSHSRDGQLFVGANKKAKANMVTIIGELIENAENCVTYPDYEGKHGKKAACGWHRYDVRFAMPQYDNKGNVSGYSNYISRMVVRGDESGTLYLYDFLRTKKEK